jgi:hypothetical protein
VLRWEAGLYETHKQAVVGDAHQQISGCEIRDGDGVLAQGLPSTPSTIAKLLAKPFLTSGLDHCTCDDLACDYRNQSHLSDEPAPLLGSSYRCTLECLPIIFKATALKAASSGVFDRCYPTHDSSGWLSPSTGPFIVRLESNTCFVLVPLLPPNLDLQVIRKYLQRKYGYRGGTICRIAR